MNGRDRIHSAAKRQGWTYGGLEISHNPVTMQWEQTLMHDEYNLIVQVYYSGYTVKSALLQDVETGEKQWLTAQSRDKAARIEDVLLGNGRRF